MWHIIENIKIDLDIILSLQKVGIVSEMINKVKWC